MIPYGKDYSAAYSAHWQQWGAGALAPFVHELAQRDEGAWLDVACGSGEVAAYAAQQGFHATGVDASPHQIRHAKAKAPGATFVVDDALTFDLKRKFDIVTCLGGSTNYFTTKRDLERLLRRMAAHVADGGAMVFDVNLPGAYAENAGRTIAVPDAQRPLMTTIRYDPRKYEPTLHMIGFAPAGKLWRRFEEEHRLRAWEGEQVERVLERLGFGYERFDIDTLCEADDQTVRLLYRCAR